MAVSLIIPTRMRTKALSKSIGSVVGHARHTVEVLLALDVDDIETAEYLKTDPIPNSRVVVGPRVGYGGLHLYVNALARIATGDWLFLWNDDCIMETQGWDSVVGEYDGQMVVLNPQSNHSNQERGHCVFPIVPRRMVEILGHFSLSKHNDTLRRAHRQPARHPARRAHPRVARPGRSDREQRRRRPWSRGRLMVTDCAGRTSGRRGGG